MAEHSVSWTYRVSANAGESMRDRLCNRLRRWIDRIDGRTSVAYRVKTEPPLNRAQTVEVLRQGFAAVERSCRDAVQLEATEHLLRACEPELFGVERPRG